MNKVLNIILKPKFLILPICVLAIYLLVYVFTNNLSNTFFAYFSYLYSTYALIIFLIWLVPFIRSCYLKYKKTRLYNWLKYDKESVTRVTLLSSSVFYLFYGIFKLVFGVAYKSWWFITFAVYYLILCIINFFVSHYMKDNKYKSILTKLIGYILIVINIILLGMVILILTLNQEILYPGYLIYLVALCDFYLVINSFIKIFTYRKQNNKIVYISKFLSFSMALISILSLEVAMINQFGDNNENFMFVMVLITGIGIFIINLISSIFLIYKAHIDN